MSEEDAKQKARLLGEIRKKDGVTKALKLWATIKDQLDWYKQQQPKQ